MNTRKDPKRAGTFSHKGYTMPDPTATRKRPGSSFFQAVLATALFRCWHLLIFFAAWSTLITVLNEQGHRIFIQPTLLTVVGTVLGFVISYRTTSSFERYNEGRRLWSQIILASRTFARTTWFHVPDAPANDIYSAEEQMARSMIERKTVINLLEAYAVAVKHYLRGEDGIYYKDLYYLVKFLPAYALPPGIPSQADLAQPAGQETLSPTSPTNGHAAQGTATSAGSFLYQRHSQSVSQLPMPNTTAGARPPPVKTTQFAVRPSAESQSSNLKPPASPLGDKIILHREDENYLLPASNPPKFYILDIFPFSLVVKSLTKRGASLKGKKAARLRAKMRESTVSHNLPLEISLYLSSYIAALQRNKVADVPTINALLLALNQLVDGLTGLERILTTPIPFSYSIHLWVVTVLYCLALPFQIWATLKWITIPGTTVASFIFFGFLVAGEEIESMSIVPVPLSIIDPRFLDPFGYDKNDLNLDHFTHNIIRNELLAITSSAPPDPSLWAFSAENDLLFANDVDHNHTTRVTPDEWLQRGHAAMQLANHT